MWWCADRSCTAPFHGQFELQIKTQRVNALWRGEEGGINRNVQLRPPRQPLEIPKLLNLKTIFCTDVISGDTCKTIIF